MRTPLSKVSVLPGLTVTKRIRSSLAPQALPAQHSWSHKQPSQRSAKKLKTNGYLYSAPLSGLTSIATPQQMHRYFLQFMASYPSGLSHFTLETNKKRHSRQYDFNSHVAGRSASLHESGRVLSSRAGSGNTTRITYFLILSCIKVNLTFLQKWSNPSVVGYVCCALSIMHP